MADSTAAQAPSQPALAVLIEPRLTERWKIRLALRFAAATAALFTVILAVGSDWAWLLFSLFAIAIVVIVHGISQFVRTRAQLSGSWLVGLALAIGAIASLATGLPIVAFLGAGPLGVCFIIVAVLRESARRNQPTGHDQPTPLAQMAVIVPTGLLYIAAWYRALQGAVDAYESLPVEPPNDCYVATAASHGHRTLVGSVATHDGCQVNNQLRQIKAGEIILRLATPRLHRRMRAAYDHAGPRIAEHCRTVWLADLSFVALVPFQLIARLLVLVLGRPGAALANKVYVTR